MGVEQEEPGRRPISSRETGWAQRISASLASAGISPNLISVLSVAAAAVGFGCFLATAFAEEELHRRLFWFLAVVAVQLRLLCNLFDGMVALRTTGPSALGQLFNEVPDRFADLLLLAGVGFAAASSPVLGLLAVSLAILTAYLRSFGESLRLPSDFGGPMAKPHRMALITLLGLWMALTPASWGHQIQGWISAPRLALLLLVAGTLLTSLLRLRRMILQVKTEAPKDE